MIFPKVNTAIDMQGSTLSGLSH